MPDIGSRNSFIMSKQVPYIDETILYLEDLIDQFHETAKNVLNSKLIVSVNYAICVRISYDL